MLWALIGQERINGSASNWKQVTIKNAMLCSVASVLWDPMGYSPPGSSVQGILQARILEWVAVPSIRGSSQPRDQTLISCVSSVGKQILSYCPTWKAHFEPYNYTWSGMLGEMRGAGMGNTTKMNDIYSFIHLCLYVFIMHILCRYTGHMYSLHIYSAIRTEDTSKPTYMQCIGFSIESWSWITYTPIYSHDTYIV